MIPIYIHSSSSYIGEETPGTDLLKEEIGRYTSETFRRVNRFILLSLLGAHQCVYKHTLDPDTGIYVATEHGNLGETAAILDEIFVSRSLPKPFGFINTMSGTAAFYLARSLGLLGRNITVSAQHLSFERALELLTADFAVGVVRSALIGGADEALRSRTALESETNRGWNVVDGSAWFYVKTEKDGACASFTDMRSFRDVTSFNKWIGEYEGTTEHIVSFGAMMGNKEAAVLRDTIRPAAEFDYLDEYGYSGSATTCGIGLFVKMFRQKTLLHINRDQRGHYTIVKVERY